MHVFFLDFDIEYHLDTISTGGADTYFVHGWLLGLLRRYVATTDVH